MVVLRIPVAGVVTLADAGSISIVWRIKIMFKKLIPHLMPKIARHYGWRFHVQFFMLGLATIWEGLIIVLSLGFLNCDIRAHLIFEIFED